MAGPRPYDGPGVHLNADDFDFRWQPVSHRSHWHEAADLTSRQSSLSRC